MVGPTAADTSKEAPADRLELWRAVAIFADLRVAILSRIA